MYAGSLGAPSSSTHLSAWFLGSSLDECECLIRSCLNLYNVLQRISHWWWKEWLRGGERWEVGKTGGCYMRCLTQVGRDGDCWRGGRGGTREWTACRDRAHIVDRRSSFYTPGFPAIVVGLTSGVCAVVTNDPHSQWLNTENASSPKTSSLHGCERIRIVMEEKELVLCQKYLGPAKITIMEMYVFHRKDQLISIAKSCLVSQMIYSPGSAWPLFLQVRCPDIGLSRALI